MTGAEDWINCPLRLMRGLFAESGPGADWERAVTASFQEKLQDNTSANQVPSVNSTPLHYLEPDGLVRFRCMVQDMFDPEFYMGVFETVDSGTNARTLHFGKYRDAVSCAPPQEVDAHSSQNVTCERQTFYCVPIPGEARWAKEAHSALSQVHGRAASTSASRAKRSYEETGPNEEAHAGDHRHKDTKRLETQSRSAQQVPSCAGNAPIDLNFPLPGEKGPACLIKLYENWDNFKVNDAIEVFGVLSVDPHLSDDWDSASMDGMDTAEEQRVHSPPTSLVPRIHAILVRRLQHDNPLMPIDVQESAEGKLFLSSFMSERSAICAGLHGFLTHALLGDSLAAEYLLLHLISTVYARRDVLPLGKFTVNLSGCPPGGTFAETLYRVLQQLVPASYYLPMTIENMNRLRFVPRKDYAANRLVSGVLQLSAHTSLLVDETVLEQGQLDTTGVRNLTALGNLITWQKVDYDFNYHQMEFPCNINVLVASEGRSLLPSDCQVPLRPQTVSSSVEHYVEALLAATLPAQLNQFRVFLSALRFLEYSISDEVTKAVEEDFVDMRRTDPQNMNAEDLHRLLVVARLVSLSAGQTTLCQETWLRAKRLEEQRKGRLQEQKYVSGNEQ